MPMRNDSIDNFRIELNKPSLRGSFYVRQGDTRARTIHITITDNGKIVDLSDAKICELLIKKPDNNQNDQTMVRVGNELQYTLRTQDINVAGECLCQVMVTFKDGTFLTTPTFSVMVYQKEVDQNLEKSTNEYTALSAIILDVEGTQAEINSYVDEKTNEITEIATTATTAATNASASATAASNSADDAEDQADAAARSASDCATYASNCAGLAANCATYLDDVTGIAATKLDKNNPVGTGTMNMPTIKANRIDAIGNTLTISNKAVFETSNNIYSIGEIVSNMATKGDIYDAVANKVDKNNPITSGTMIHTGTAHIDSLDCDYVTATNIASFDKIAPLSGSNIDVYADLKIGSADIYYGNEGKSVVSSIATNTSNIATNTADIAELKNKPSGITLTSASSLQSSTASSIVGIDVDGCSTQTVTLPLVLGKSWDRNANTNRAFFDLTVSPSTSYTFKHKVVSGVDAVNVMEFSSSSSNTIIAESGDIKSQTSKTITTSATTTNIRVLMVASNSATFTQSLADSLEMVVDGYAPTPTNPIAIVDASGDVIAHTPNIIEGTDDWSGTWVGADKWTTDGTYLGLTVKKGTVTWNGLHKKFDAVSGKTYTISAYVKGSTSSTNLVCYTTTSALVGSKTIGTEWQRVSMSYTATASGEFGLRFESSNDANLSICGYMISTDGSDTYAPYASNKITLPTLRSCGTVKDELIVNADGSGQIVRRVAEVDLGSFTWVRTSNHFYAKASGFNAKKVGSSAIMDALCASYPIVSTDTVGAETQTFALSLVYTSDYFFGLCDNRTTDATQMKSLLNGVKFVYALATPTTETLTSAQVASIRQLQTYSGTTIVDSALDVKSVTYHADTKQYIDGRTDYSYTDTIIGKWADGKPLHRMVIQTTTPSSTNAWTNIATSVNGNIADVKDYKGTIKVDTNRMFNINFYNGANYFISTIVNADAIAMYISNASYASKPCEIIAEYTLNDDAEISVLSEGGDE